MIDLALLLPWLERETRAVDTVSASLTARLAALLDRPQRKWSDGDAVPASWYVQLFGPTAPQSVLGPDGHPPKGELLPPVPWPRRMFAGRRIELPGDLKVGDEVVRTSRVTAIEPKTGRSGEMCFVTVRHELTTRRGLAVVEEQDVVYRPALEQGASTPAAAQGKSATGEPVMRQAQFVRTLVPDTTLLFRYSAITNNAHRIHYDLPYARDVEGYPALVVNGGLSTLLLWELAGKSFDGRLHKSTTRNLKPLFVDRTITLCASSGAREGGVQAWVQDDTDAVAIEADLEFT
jgi:3-methylfumaryl-CoA hydratase